jgi:hypothetical protein
MKQQYDKVILAASAVLGLGVAYLGFSKSSNAEADFEFFAKSNGQGEVAVQSAPLLTSTLALVDQPHTVQQAVCADSQRPVDQFVGVALFAKKAGSGDKIAKPVDPINDAPIHPPIPNTWWLENRIDPGYADSPQRDEDGDGFTNLEEFEAKTDPAEDSAHPPLIKKLQFVKYESIGYFLWFSSALGPEQYQFKIVELPAIFESAPRPQQEQYLANAALRYNRTKDFIGSGVNIFETGYGKDRFRLKGVSEKEVTNEATKLTTKNDFAVIEDLAPHKMDSFEIPKTPKAKDRPATVRYDRTAVLVLDAIGQEGKEFKVLEHTSFALPFGKGEKNYRLANITSTAVTIEFKDAEGKVQSVEIPKNP